MTTFARMEYKCAVCGKKHDYMVISSTNSFGSPDLDLRPPEMKRSTMSHWVQECPCCGYVSGEVADKTTVPKAFFKSAEYRTTDGIGFKSALAARFYKNYMVSLRENQKDMAWYALLCAAWACDDGEDEECAVKCRLLALPLVTESIESEPENADTLRVLAADLMRRAGLFAELKEQYASVRFEDDLLNKIMAYELGLAGKGDSSCHRVAEAMNT